MTGDLHKTAYHITPNNAMVILELCKFHLVIDSSNRTEEVIKRISYCARYNFLYYAPLSKVLSKSNPLYLIFQEVFSQTRRFRTIRYLNCCRINCTSIMLRLVRHKLGCRLSYNLNKILFYFTIK